MKKIISWNVRSLNDAKKKNIITECLDQWKPIIVCFQETKIKIIYVKTIRSIWRSGEVGWPFIPTKGSAGDILVPWNKDKVDCIDSMIGETTVSYFFSDNVNEAEWYYSDVYCRGDEIERVTLWEELSTCQTK